MPISPRFRRSSALALLALCLLLCGFRTSIAWARPSGAQARLFLSRPLTPQETAARNTHGKYEPAERLLSGRVHRFRSQSQAAPSGPEQNAASGPRRVRADRAEVPRDVLLLRRVRASRAARLDTLARRAWQIRPRRPRTQRWPEICAATTRTCANWRTAWLARARKSFCASARK